MFTQSGFKKICIIKGIRPYQKRIDWHFPNGKPYAIIGLQEYPNVECKVKLHNATEFIKECTQNEN